MRSGYRTRKRSFASYSGRFSSEVGATASSYSALTSEKRAVSYFSMSKIELFKPERVIVLAFGKLVVPPTIGFAW